MEATEKNPQHMNRTEYVIANITGVKTPLELKTAEKLASRRLGELEAIVKGISTKWFKGKLDEQMLAQTRAEMDKITQALSAKRDKFGRVV
jgi:DNA-binding HxlR family transcriptional regulator